MSSNGFKKKAIILSLLKDEKRVSGNKLADRLDISRQALHKQIQSLRNQHYQINGTPKIGYCLSSQPDILTPERILNGLKTKKIGKKIFYSELMDSTQDKAKEFAGNGEKEGSLVIAEKQRKGRGRLGRSWISNAGGIWISLILRPKIVPQNVPQLALVFSLAVAKAIEDVCHVQCGLKWPNDVLILDAGYRKVCGILTEMSAESERVNWMVLGIGINANNSLPKGLRDQAISLKEAVGQKINRVNLVQTLLKESERIYEIFLENGFAHLRKIYLEKLILKGKEITIVEQDKQTSGKFLDIAENGSLILLTPGQEKLKFFSGDVTIQK